MPGKRCAPADSLSGTGRAVRGKRPQLRGHVPAGVRRTVFVPLRNGVPQQRQSGAVAGRCDEKFIRFLVWANRVGTTADPSGFTEALYYIGGAGSGRWNAHWNSADGEGIHFGFDGSLVTPVSQENRPVNVAVRYLVKAKN